MPEGLLFQGICGRVKATSINAVTQEEVPFSAACSERSVSGCKRSQKPEKANAPVSAGRKFPGGWLPLPGRTVADGL